MIKRPISEKLFPERGDSAIRDLGFGLRTINPAARWVRGALQKYKDIEGVVKMEEVDGQEMVKSFAEEMEEMLGRKMKSVKVLTHSLARSLTHSLTRSLAQSLTLSLARSLTRSLTHSLAHSLSL